MTAVCQHLLFEGKKYSVCSCVVWNVLKIAFLEDPKSESDYKSRCASGWRRDRIQMYMDCNIIYTATRDTVPFSHRYIDQRLGGVPSKLASSVLK